MICQVYKNKKGDIEQVLAPNGKESVLFKDLEKLVNNKELALIMWRKANTPAFKKEFGNSSYVDENGEPRLIGSSYVTEDNRSISALLEPVGDLGNLTYNFVASEIILNNLPKISGLANKIGLIETFWNKLQQDFKIPKIQVNLIKESNGETFDERFTNFLSNYSYTVEVNTAKETKKYINDYDNFELDGDIYTKIDTYRKNGEKITKEEYSDAINKKGNVRDEQNTGFYSYLTVPGGINYTENEIATPAITPSIKGHAQFATDKGIGWFRSDEKTNDVLGDDIRPISSVTGKEVKSKFLESSTPTKTRRILEVQSDLFQKSRDNFKTKDYIYSSQPELQQEKLRYRRTSLKTNETEFITKKEFLEAQEEARFTNINNKEGFLRKDQGFGTDNQFLQLLNKDNNWVTFFIKSIIQDSAKKGYEKVLFPTGKTIEKIEGFNRITEELEKINNAISKYENIINEKQGENITGDVAKLDKLQSQKKHFLAAQKDTLSTINFYENTVSNILKKQGYNPTLITDEYGNTWNEISVLPKHAEAIAFDKSRAHLMYSRFDQSLYNKNVDNLFGDAILSDSDDVSFDSTKVLEKVLSEGNVSKDLIELAKLVQGLNVKIKFFRPNDYVNYPDHAAYYDGNYQVIRLNEYAIGMENTKELTKILLHEMVHHYTLTALLFPQTEQERRFKAQMELLFEKFKKANPDSKSYGFLNVREFVTEIMTDVEFRNELNKTKFNSEMSIWERFLDFINTLFNTSFGKTTSKIVNGAMNDILSLIETGNRMGGIRPSKVMAPYTFGRKAVTKNDIITKMDQLVKLQKEIYKDRKSSTEFIARLQVLEDFSAKKQEVAYVAKMVADAEHYLTQLASKYKEIKALEGRKDITQEEVSDILKKLNEIKNFASSYTILNDIQNFLLDDNANLKRVAGLSNQDEKAYIEHIAALIAHRDNLLTNYMQYATSALTGWLMPFLDEVNTKLVASGEASHVLNADQLKEMLTEAPKDIGFFSAMVGATINSSDPVNSLVAKAIKWQLEQARMRDIKTQNELLALYSEKTGPKNSPDKFNSEYIREITLPDGSKVLALQTALNWHEYYTNVKNLSKSLEERGILKGSVEYKKAWGQFYKDNTELRPDYKEYIESLKSRLTPDQFKNFMLKHTREVDLGYFDGDERLIYSQDGMGKARVLTGNFKLPKAAKYKNKKFEELQQNDPYFKLLYKTYEKANFQLPNARRLRFGMLPQIQKSSFDGVLENGVDVSSHLARVKEWWKSRGTREGIDEQKYGRVALENLAGEKIRFLPIYYTTQLEDQKEVSKDLLQSVLLFSQMANKFDVLYDILPHIQTFETVVLGSKTVPNSGRKVVETVPGTVQAVVNKITNTNVFKETARINERIKHFIDSSFYGQDTLKIEMNLPFIGQVNADKFFDKIGWINALSTMTLSFVGGVNNLVIGNYNNLNEAIVKRHITGGTWKDAQIEFGKLLISGELLGDIGKQFNKSKLGQLMDLYDAIQGEFSDQFGKKISGNKAKNLFSMSALFVFNNITEYEIQGTAFLAKLMNEKVQTKDGKTINLYDAYEVKDGVLKLKDGVIFNEKDRFRVMNEVHGMNKDLQGNYNNFDKSVLQRYSVGRLALMFRKYVYTGFVRRWGEEQVDYEQGIVKEGYFRTFLTKLSKDFKDGQYFTLFNWSNLTQKERKAFMQTSLELGLWLLVAGIFGMLDDDEDKSKFEQHLLLQLRRFQADLAFFTGIGAEDMFRLMNTPAVSMDFVGKTANLLNHIVFEWDEEDLFYQRDTGTAKKGDRKSYEKLKKLIPGLRAWTVMQSPEEQLKVFNK